MGAPVPAGGRLLIVDGVYVVQYDVGNGLRVYYDFSAPGTMGQVSTSGYGPAQQVAHDAFYGQQGLIHGGLVQEILGIKDPSYQAWFDKTLNIATGGASWVNNPEMRAIYADWIVNPETSSDEIEARVKQTGYWKGTTDAQRQYNNSSPAEQAKMQNDAAASLANNYFQITGQTINLADPQLRQWATSIASGAQTAGFVVESFIKPIALQNPQSPWSRSIQDEHAQEQQRGVDVSNQSEQVRDLYRRWIGQDPDPNTVSQWANDLVSKQKSEADLLTTLQQQSKQLYPWKDSALETSIAAQPWLSTYSRVLERPADLTNPDVQRALTSGQAPWAFEQDLKRKDEWLSTKNGQASVLGAVGSVGRLMGFE
jgi:hypothetical protein